MMGQAGSKKFLIRGNINYCYKAVTVRLVTRLCTALIVSGKLHK